MKTFLIAYFSSLISLLALDYLWLSTMLSRFYSQKLSHLTAQTPSYTPAVFFYIIYAIGVTVLIVYPALESNHSLFKVFLFGGLFGLCAYGAYDLTNQATLRDWPTIVTVVDLLWGSFLTGVVSVIAVYITKIFS